MKQGIIGFVVGVLMGVGAMLLFDGAKYEMVPHTPMTAWILNTKTGKAEIISVQGRLSPDDAMAKPTPTYIRIATEEEAARFKPLP